MMSMVSADDRLSGSFCGTMRTDSDVGPAAVLASIGGTDYGWTSGEADAAPWVPCPYAVAKACTVTQWAMNRVAKMPTQQSASPSWAKISAPSATRNASA